VAIARKLDALGRTIAEMQDAALATRSGVGPTERLADVHREHARRAAARQGVSLRRSLSLAVAALATAAVFLLWFSHEQALEFTVGPSMKEAERGELGVWVSAPAKEPSVIAFSDGSKVRLTAGAQARVVSTSEHGARVVVERGSVRADVVPRARNDWWVIGGPFEIHVTGTSFDARWEPEHESLHVTMYEGHVEIRAECLPRVRSLSRGESAVIECPRGELAVTAPKPSPSAESVSVPLLAAPAAPAAPAATRPSARPERGRATASDIPPLAAPSWNAWARLGSYKEALTAAEREGFGSLSATLSLGELLELATTARLAGNAARATEAYSAVRSRFSGTDGAATAAFHLGQLAFDGARSYAEAHRYFTTYLRERPSGALAAEALGRLMEAEQRLGDLTAARATATVYVQRYPAGAHARLAKSLLVP
jgi:transmembrane sensor